MEVRPYVYNQGGRKTLFDADHWKILPAAAEEDTGRKAQKNHGARRGCETEHGGDGVWRVSTVRSNGAAEHDAVPDEWCVRRLEDEPQRVIFRFQWNLWPLVLWINVTHQGVRWVGLDLLWKLSWLPTEELWRNVRPVCMNRKWAGRHDSVKLIRHVSPYWQKYKVWLVQIPNVVFKSCYSCFLCMGMIHCWASISHSGALDAARPVGGAPEPCPWKPTTRHHVSDSSRGLWNPGKRDRYICYITLSLISGKNVTWRMESASLSYCCLSCSQQVLPDQDMWLGCGRSWTPMMSLTMWLLWGDALNVHC